MEPRNLVSCIKVSSVTCSKCKSRLPTRIQRSALGRAERGVYVCGAHFASIIHNTSPSTRFSTHNDATVQPVQPPTRGLCTVTSVSQWPHLSMARHRVLFIPCLLLHIRHPTLARPSITRVARSAENMITVSRTRQCLVILMGPTPHQAANIAV